MAGTKYQYFATFIANLLTITCGMGGGWGSPNLPYLSSDETPLDEKLTMEEKSLIAALLCLGALAGNLFFAWLSDKFGRKYPLMFVAIPQIIGWTLILYAKNAVHLYIARFAIGIVGGGVFVIIPVYVSEIADDHVRGTLGAMLVLTANFGGLLAFTFGDYCQYEFTPICVISITLVFLCAFYFFPETPTVLQKQNQMEEAEKSMCFYRNIDRDSKSEMAILQVELNKLQLLQEKSPSGDGKLCLADFTTITARKALLICLMLCSLNQLCGCFAMMNYTATIFQEAGSNLAPNSSAIIVGIIQLFGAYASTILVDRAGRKLLLTVSATLTSLGLSCLGAYLYLKSMGYPVESYGWIPVCCFSFVIFFVNLGVLSLPFLVISELLPNKIKNAGACVCLCYLNMLAFIVVKYFPMMSYALGMHGSMFVFSVFSLTGAISVMLVLPETKGKSFDEIMELLKR